MRCRDVICSDIWWNVVMWWQVLGCGACHAKYYSVTHETSSNVEKRLAKGEVHEVSSVPQVIN